jgi:hypothetical protein
MSTKTLGDTRHRLLLAVEVPAGTSRIRLADSPASWRLGRWLLLLAVLGAWPALRWGSEGYGRGPVQHLQSGAPSTGQEFP